MSLKIISIDSNNTHQLIEFIKNLGKSKLSFRYFENRPISVLKNHLLTILLLLDNHPIGYGHIDFDGERYWLGISLIEKEVGKGYGSMIMKELLHRVSKKNVKTLHLSVDIANHGAVKMYQKYGFLIEKSLSDKYLMVKYVESC